MNNHRDKTFPQFGTSPEFWEMCWRNGSNTLLNQNEFSTSNSDYLDASMWWGCRLGFRSADTIVSLDELENIIRIDVIPFIGIDLQKELA